MAEQQENCIVDAARQRHAELDEQLEDWSRPMNEEELEEYLDLYKFFHSPSESQA